MIDTYTELKAAIADWLNREDLTAQIPTFISLTEVRINRTLRVRDMLKRFYADVSEEYVPPPSDYLETYRMEISTSQNGVGAIDYISPLDAADMKAGRLTGPTRYYTIINNSFQLIPPPASGTRLSLVYYAKVPELTDAAPSNWLLGKAPDLYLYGALTTAAPYLSNDERITVWSQLAISAFDELMNDSERASRSRTSLNARAVSF